MQSRWLTSTSKHAAFAAWMISFAVAPSCHFWEGELASHGNSLHYKAGKVSQMVRARRETLSLIVSRLQQASAQDAIDNDAYKPTKLSRVNRCRSLDGATSTHIHKEV